MAYGHLGPTTAAAPSQWVMVYDIEPGIATIRNRVDFSQNLVKGPTILK